MSRAAVPRGRNALARPTKVISRSESLCDLGSVSEQVRVQKVPSPSCPRILAHEEEEEEVRWRVVVDGLSGADACAVLSFPAHATVRAMEDLFLSSSVGARRQPSPLPALGARCCLYFGRVAFKHHLKDDIYRWVLINFQLFRYRVQSGYFV